MIIISTVSIGTIKSYFLNLSNWITGASASKPIIQGAAVDNAAKAGNPLQIGGIYSTTPATRHDGDAVAWEMTSTGAGLVSLSGRNVVKETLFNAQAITTTSITYATIPTTVSKCKDFELFFVNTHRVNDADTAMLPFVITISRERTATFNDIEYAYPAPTNTNLYGLSTTASTANAVYRTLLIEIPGFSTGIPATPRDYRNASLFEVMRTAAVYKFYDGLGALQSITPDADWIDRFIASFKRMIITADTSTAKIAVKYATAPGFGALTLNFRGLV